MLTIRLQRTGKRNEPKFRVVVAEKAWAVKGKFLDVLGHYLPTGKKSFCVNNEALLKWIGKGAQPSNTLATLLKKNGVSEMEKFITRPMDKKRLKKKGSTQEEAPKKEEKAPQPTEQAKAA